VLLGAAASHLHEEDDVAAVAADVWDSYGFAVPEQFSTALKPLLCHPNPPVRVAAAGAIAAATEHHPTMADAVLDDVLALFAKHASGRRAAEPDSIDARTSVLRTIAECGSSRTVPAARVEPLLRFAISEGMCDSAYDVRGAALSAGTSLVNGYAEYAAELITIFEAFLESGAADSMAASTEAARDAQREGVVVLLGAAASHLHEEDPKVMATMEILMATLNTPSEPVQRAVSQCLPRLVKSLGAGNCRSHVEELVARTVSGDTMAVRRGGAFGLGGFVKGLGLPALKSMGIMAALEGAAGNMKVPPARQGAMFAYECLSERLGLLFEPYVIRILPSLLKSFGDGNPDVRAAAQGASRIIMSKLSTHGVKLVLPALLGGLEETAWRSKVASIKLLGSMSHGAAKVLASALPQIVPQLIAAYDDTHPKVHTAVNESLKDIGSVIRNPEVAGIVSTLLAALSDPAAHTHAALVTLANTEFVHAIDPPSLALLMPILERGLKDRATDVKKGASVIVGNMCALIRDPLDLVPYLDALVAPLKKALVDPIPDVRAVVSGALAGLISGLGEAQLPGLVDWLINTLQAPGMGVERSGGAQGLCEVAVAIGEPRLTEILSQVLPLADSPEAPAREGVMWVLAFMSGAMGEDFAALINVALPLIIQGLADKDDGVREVSQRAGQVLVNQFTHTHTDLVVPPLVDGLLDENWRIRQGCLNLTGDLLHIASGGSPGLRGSDAAAAIVAAGEGEGNEDGSGSDSGSESEDDDELDALAGTGVTVPGSGGASGGVQWVEGKKGKNILSVLGATIRNKVFAMMYIMRQDSSGTVRQVAIAVWKSLVSNTPRMLRTILPSLMEVVIHEIASPNAERQTVAARTLGDVVKKLGERVLPEIIPLLRSNLRAPDAETRQGVCIGMAEVIGGTTSKQLSSFVDVIIPAVQDALCDEMDIVREAAAEAFNTLQRTLGQDAVDRIIPALLRSLDTDDHEAGARAMHGLRAVLQLRAKEILPFLLPRLCSAPISDFNARALAAVAEVTGPVLHSYFKTLLPAVLAALTGTETAEQETEGKAIEDLLASDRAAHLATAVKCITGEGVHFLVVRLAEVSNDASPNMRAAACWLMGQYVSGTKGDFSAQVPIIIKDILPRIADSNESVTRVAVETMKQLMTRVTPEGMMEHMDFLYKTLRGTLSDVRFRRGGGAADYILPAFTVPKSIDPYLSVFSEGLQKGSADIREVAATAIGEIIMASDLKVLRPHIMRTTGPLIRIAGDKFPAKVKSSILHTLSLFVTKGGVLLKPLMPQLQTTFVKALNDTETSVRDKAAEALGKLMLISPRVDPVVNELAGRVGKCSGGVQEAMLGAMHSVLHHTGAKVAEKMRVKALGALAPLMVSARLATQSLAAAALGALARFLSAELQEEVMNGYVLSVDALEDFAEEEEVQPWVLSRGQALLIAGLAKYSPAVLASTYESVLGILEEVVEEDNAAVRTCAAGAAGHVFLCAMGGGAGSGSVAEGEGGGGGGGGSGGAAADDAVDTSSPSAAKAAVKHLVTLLGDADMDVQAAAALAVKVCTKCNRDAVLSASAALVPALVPLTSHKQGGVRYAADRAMAHVFRLWGGEGELVSWGSKCKDKAVGAVALEAGRKVTKRSTGGDSEDEEDVV
jgi:HEAT repeat protein